MVRQKRTKQYINSEKQVRAVKLTVIAIISLFQMICLTSCASDIKSEKIETNCIMSVVTWGNALECLAEQ